MGTTSKKGAMCRICLRKKRKFISIFKYSNQFKYIIADLLMECAPLHVCLLITSEDGFPRWICTICNNNLKIVHQFRKLAVKSEEKLIEMLNKEDNITKKVDAKYNEFFLSENVDDVNSSTMNYTTTDNFYSSQPQQTSEDIITSDLNQHLENIHQNIKLEPIDIDFNQVDLQNPPTGNESIVKIENTTEYGYNTNDTSEFQKDIKEEYLITPMNTEIYNEPDTAIQKENEHLLPLYPNSIKFDEAEFQQYTNTAGNCSNQFCGSNSDLAESYILFDALNKVTAKKSNKSRLMLQCKVCKQLFFDARSKNEHMQSHKKYYECEKCEKTFIKWSAFLAHRRRHNRETPYLCGACETYYPTKTSLISHLRTHTSERPFNCDRCMKDFRASSQLMSHRRWNKCQPVVCMESV